jgi:hypothetical protein
MKKHFSVTLLLAAMTTTPCWSQDLIPADRRTTWNPGLNSVGGIPNRTTVYTTINAATYGNGAQDATVGIQTAINNCPAGQVVQLSAGIFTINSGIVFVNKGITLRGAGSTLTTLQHTTSTAAPVIIVGPSRWNSPGTGYTLAADAVKGASSVQMSAAPSGGLASGQIVLIDELSGAGWRTDPLGLGQIWASADFRVVYQRHNPSQQQDDPWPDAAGWFCRQDRPTCEIKEVQTYNATTKTVTFTSPLHIDYRTAHTAQLFVYAAVDTHVRNAGVEDIKVVGGRDGNLRFENAAYCWAARVEDTGWLGEGFAVDNSFRVEVRDSYVHSPVVQQPGGGSYNLSLANGSSEILLENTISWNANKVMVARCSGAGSVIGYNYMDDGHIDYAPSWVEIGLNASHMVGPHHVLFEGNYCFNADSDDTHGNSILHTYFRNHLSGQRRNAGLPVNYTDGGPRRCVGLMAYSYWMSFVGNVLGRPGQMSGWVYESQNADPAIWLLGWDTGATSDPNVIARTYRHGNFDYLTTTQKWDPGNSNHTLPNSLYLTAKPAFFGSRTWPWVQPEGATQLYSLPAKERFDAIKGAPTIASFTPTSGPAGTGVTITGTNLTGATGVKFNGTGANFTVASGTSITTTVPAGATTGKIAVTTPGGTATSAATFTVTTPSAPTVASPAAATPNPVAGKTASLSVLGADAGGEAGLTYTWSAVPATVTFSPNGTNGAKNGTATFSAAGTYTLTSTIRNAVGGTVASSTSVTVSQTSTSVSVTPASASVATQGTKDFNAVADDQFGHALASQPTFTWSVSGGGTINGTGLFTAGGTAGGPFTVTAIGGGKSGTALVTVTPSASALTTIQISPASATVAPLDTHLFTSLGLDQFGNPMSPQPTFTWTVSGGGTIDGTGLFTAGSAAGGPFTITSTSGSVNGTAAVMVAAPAIGESGGGAHPGGCGLIGLEGMGLVALLAGLGRARRRRE